MKTTGDIRTGIKSILTNIRAKKNCFIYDRKVGCEAYSEADDIQQITGCIRDATGCCPEFEVQEIQKSGDKLMITLNICGSGTKLIQTEL